MESEGDDEDGQEEEGEISTYLRSKNPCFLDHCLSDLPKGNWRDRLISLIHEFLHLFVLRFDERCKIFLQCRNILCGTFIATACQQEHFMNQIWFLNLLKDTAILEILRCLYLIKDRIRELSRSSGETKTPPIYSGETHQRHHLLRRNPVQNPSDHEVQSGRRASMAISEMEAGTSSRHSGIGRRRRGRTLTRTARDERLSLGRRRSTRRRSENSESNCDQSLIKRNIWAWLIEAKVIEENIKICCLTETQGHACKMIFLSTF